MPSCSWWLYSYVKMRGDPKGARVGLDRVRRDWPLERHGFDHNTGEEEQREKKKRQ